MQMVVNLDSIITQAVITLGAFWELAYGALQVFQTQLENKDCVITQLRSELQASHRHLACTQSFLKAEVVHLATAL